MTALCYGKKGASLNVLEMFHLAMTPIMTSCFLLTARVFWSADSKQFSLRARKCSGIFWVLWIGAEDRKSNPKNGGHRKSSVLNRLRMIPGSHSLPSATRQARKSYTVWVTRVPRLRERLWEHGRAQRPLPERLLSPQPHCCWLSVI